MTKQTRDDSMQAFMPTPTYTLPSWNPEEDQDPINWLRLMDITSHDYPYIIALLENTFRNWASQLPSTPAPYRAQWFVADSAGEFVESGEDAPPPETEQTIVDVTRRCLRENQVVISGFPGGFCVASPVLTRHTVELFAVLGCTIHGPETAADFAESWVVMAAQFFKTCFYKEFEAMFISDLLHVQKLAKREEYRRSILFQVIQELHDKKDVDSVLTEVFGRIAGLFPEADVELLMSQDYLSRDPRVKSLQLQEARDNICARAFMEGVTLRSGKGGGGGEDCLEIAVPLVGKQGVYGVFHLVMPPGDVEEVDLQLVSMLADTAGSAFESAKLYEQSNLLVSELRLINELTKRLNQSLRLKEVFKFATEELLSIFRAEFCCITQLDKEGEVFEVMASNVPSLSKAFFSKDYGFSGLVLNTREPVILSDYRAYGKVSSKLMDETDSRSLIVAPLIVRGEGMGAIMLAHRAERFFSYENYRLLQVLSSHIGLAIANASLHAEVQRMANHDMLTGLYARHYLDDRIQSFQKRDEGGSLIIVDIDLFKQVNDTYGHQIGDKILKQVCSIILRTVRKTDIAARWGGEELAIYLPGADMHSGYQIAETIRLQVATECEPRVTVSCGIAEWNRESDKISVESLFYLADMALYKAKKNGRNQTQIGLSPEGEGER